MLKRGNQSPLCRPERSLNKTQISPKNISAKTHTVHNQDKLKVFIKFKPNQRQINNDATEQVRYINEKEIQIKTSIKNKIYHFDHVFQGNQSHLQVVDIGCKDIIDHVYMETYEKNHANHGLIFVYGNTGTGKTYTMGLLNTIQKNSEGVVPDSLRYIFQVKKKKSYENYQISVSFCEIYMDQIYDLLDFQGDTKLSIRQDSKTKQPYLENETIIGVNSVEQAFQIINIGLEKRRVAEQRMNRKSSRGHGIITINISPCNGEKSGKLCFIDLAGCERLKESQSKGTTLSEALHINSSLSSLETLLMNISDQNVRNYRASKLTRFLQPYIEYGKINLFVTSTGDSLNAVQFAKRCKGIKFMQRQLRISTTPIKKSMISDKPAKPTKQFEQLLQFRKQSIERQKKLITCIVSLVGMFQKLTNQLQNAFKNQTIHTDYSIGGIVDNAQLENSINCKIKDLQKKQTNLLNYNIEELNCNKIEITSEDILNILNNPHQLTKQIQEQSHQLISSIKSFGAYSQYKNIYKQEFFTSQLKLHLIQQKSKTYEDGLYYLIKYMNTTDKRVTKKLKQLGITSGKQNIQNMPHLRNRKDPTKSSQKHKSVIKEIQQDEPSPFVHSQRRSAIYIDEM